jgi:hypothetical protein
LRNQQVTLPADVLPRLCKYKCMSCIKVLFAGVSIF